MAGPTTEHSLSSSDLPEEFCCLRAGVVKRGSTDIAKRRKTLLFRLGRVRDKSSLALIGEKASRLSLLLRRALVGRGHEARLTAGACHAVRSMFYRHPKDCMCGAFQRLTASACKPVTFVGCLWGGSVKGDRVRVSTCLLGLIVMASFAECHETGVFE